MSTLIIYMNNLSTNVINYTIYFIYKFIIRCIVSMLIMYTYLLKCQFRHLLIIRSYKMYFFSLKISFDFSELTSIFPLQFLKKPFKHHKPYTTELGRTQPTLGIIWKHFTAYCGPILEKGSTVPCEPHWALSVLWTTYLNASDLHR